MVNKKGAIEMSMTTIVVVVLAMSMLILGMVLVRNIMCGAMGLTTDINTKVTSQINQLFTEGGGDIEVHCVGEGGDQPIMPIGQTSFIMCTIKSNTGGKYKFGYDYTFRYPNLAEIEKKSSSSHILNFAVLGSSGEFNIQANMERPTKILQIALPSNTPTGSLSITLTVSPPKASDISNFETDPKKIYDINLDFKVQKVSGLQTTMC